MTTPGTPMATLGTPIGSPLSGVVGNPPMLWLYGTSKTLFCFGRPPDPLGALVTTTIPEAPAASNGHNFKSGLQAIKRPLHSHLLFA